MYIGNTPTTQTFTFGADSFDGNGTNVNFNLSRSVSNIFQITVIVNNVIQNPFNNTYSVSGNVLTTTAAPSIGTKNVWVHYNSYVTQLIQPGAKTVGATQLIDGGITTVNIADANVTPAKLSTGAPSWDSSGNLSFNSGYGSAATAYGCRAWVNFNGTGTVAIRASGNVSSITDLGVGNYKVNFTNVLPDTNSSVAALSIPSISYTERMKMMDLTTGYVNVANSQTGDGNVLQDSAVICVSVFR